MSPIWQSYFSTLLLHILIIFRPYKNQFHTLQLLDGIKLGDACILKNYFFYLKDTIQKHIVVVQSKNIFKDTIRISYNLKSNSNTVITYKEQIIKSINANPNFTLEFNQHIKSIDTSLIRVYRDSNKIESNFHFS